MFVMFFIWGRVEVKTLLGALKNFRIYTTITFVGVVIAVILTIFIGLPVIWTVILCCTFGSEDFNASY